MKKNLDITNSRFDERLWPVPSDLVKWSFHCNQFFLISGLKLNVGFGLISFRFQIKQFNYLPALPVRICE